MASFVVSRAAVVAPQTTCASLSRKASTTNRVSFRPAPARAIVLRSRYSQRRSQSLFVVRAEADERLNTELQAAIEAAKACTDDCAVEWDTVEEISAAVSHQNQNSEVQKVEPLSDEVVKAMANVQAAINEAQSNVQATTDATNFLKTAQTELGKVMEKSNKEPSERVKKLEAALATALKAANECEDECAPDWDTVEEISAAVDKAKRA